MTIHDQTSKRGLDMLRDPRYNKGTAFTREEREKYGLMGLLPDMVSTLDMQILRIEGHIKSLAEPIDKYVYLSDLQERNESLFYHILMGNPEAYMPVVYTPTVGLACQTFGRIYRRPKGLFISARHQGRMAEVLRNWPEPDVRWICVTDGERILGLGDLGAQGMGIPVGKLALYTACAGVPPHMTLPIVLDVGTNNEDLLNDPFYIGMRERRLTGDEYDAFIEEFVSAVEEVFPQCSIQWEDFANPNAGPILERYRDRISSFNDDIQGTAAVGVAGILSALRMKNEELKDQVFVFFGAGSAGTGIADLLCRVMHKEGIPIEEARKKCWLVDSKGLVVASREDLAETKQPFAHDHAPVHTLAEAVRFTKATALIGTSTIPKSFTKDVVEQLAANTDRPIIFPFSNPTSKSECSAEEAYTWTNGRAIFASGSPFAPVVLHGHTHYPGQGNNVYIFPGVGLAVYATKASAIPDRAFAVAARALAGMVTAEQFEKGLIYPPMANIRQAAIVVANAVTRFFFDEGLARIERPDDISAFVDAAVWAPEY
ncbi:MAG: NAD-dependent malic enzyme [Candidatus Kapabacteria bacterium]|nr:NAD-dependent malic enzyme [Ignavibacteria bacterium]MBP6509760.1 NAD-dependent malic enzyme [Candidatus Kapabacteria bacterium]MBP7094169.1 NAD-dependent malic enzyme [Candidatus Kapabacteria bacterium]